MAKILLVEDELLWQQTLSQILERKNHKVIVADSYEKAQSYLTAPAEASPGLDLVLLDPVLDEWSGNLQGMELLPLLETLHKQHNIKLIILTDQDMYANTVEAGRSALTEHKDTVFGVYDKNRVGDGKEFLNLVQQATEGSVFREDWWKPLDLGDFYGRQEELIAIKDWLLKEHCRLVTISGMGGMGKSALALKVAEEISHQFDYIFGRDLRNAPPFDEVLSDAIKFLSDQQRIDLPENPTEKIAILIEYLQQHCCLLVLDNLETILQGGEQTGQYRKGYENFGQLIQKIGSTDHQSSLIITSREKPNELMLLEKSLFVKTIDLPGLKPEDGRDILRDKNVFGREEKWQELSERYAGNPLALKLVASTIGGTFGGDIAEFLNQPSTVFGSIRDVLNQQFIRLSEREQEVMYWLAINREALSLEELQEDIVDELAKSELLGAIESLRVRSMVETSGTIQFILQPVVMEYVTDQLIEQIRGEIQSETVNSFMNYALLKASSKDYVREAQKRFVLKPLKERLIANLGSQIKLEEQLKTLLLILQKHFSLKPGYGGGNILNMFCELKTDLKGYDFSQLSIWQAYLIGVNLSYVNFTNCYISKTVFTQVFGSILSMALSPDGRFLVTGDIDGKIRLWRVLDGQQIWNSKEHFNRVRTVAFSPDGRIVASSGYDQTIRLWDLNSHKCFNIFRGHSSRIRSLAFSSDGEVLASGSHDTTVRLWKVRTGECFHILKEHTKWILSIDFSPNEQLLASSSGDNTIKLWDAYIGRCLKTLRGHTDWVWSVAFSPNGRFLASGSKDQTTRVWDVKTGECLKIFHEHTKEVLFVVFSPDGKILASASSDCTIKLWDMNNSKLIRTLWGHTKGVETLAFSPDGQVLISGSEDQVRLWDVSSGQCLTTWQGYAHSVSSVAICPHGKILASGSGDKTIKLWDLHTGKYKKTLTGHTNWIWALSFDHLGKTLASGSGDHTIKLWDMKTSECLKTFQNHTNRIWSIAFAPNGKAIASGSHDCTVKLTDITTGECLKNWKEHIGWVWSVSFSPDGRFVASGSDDNTIRLWNIENSNYHISLTGHASAVRCVAFNNDGRLLASGSEDKKVRLWDIYNHKCIKVIEAHEAWVTSLVFSPDGRILASGGADNSIKLWDVQSGRYIKSLLEHDNWILSLTFSPDGQILASASQDETIRVWDINTYTCLRILKADKIYEGMNITGVKGLAETQKPHLKELGAIEI